MQKETKFFIGITALIAIAIIVLLYMKKKKAAGTTATPQTAAAIAKGTPGNTIAGMPGFSPNQAAINAAANANAVNPANLTNGIITGLGGLFSGVANSGLFNSGSNNADTASPVQPDYFSGLFSTPDFAAQANETGNLNNFADYVNTNLGADSFNSMSSPDEIDLSGY